MTDAQHMVNELTAPLLGRSVRSIERGVGSFLMIDFAEIPEGATRSEWHFWIYMAAWRLENESGVVAGSGDTEEWIDARIDGLADAVLRSIDVDSDGTTLTFEDGLRLRMFTTAHRGDEEWMLFTPSDDVLTIRPGGEWQLEPAAGVT